MSKQSFVWAGCFLVSLLAVACGGSDSSGDPSGSQSGAAQPQGSGGSTSQGTGTPATCDQVCSAVGSCPELGGMCAGVCPMMSNACKSCLASATCSSLGSCESACNGGGSGGSSTTAQGGSSGNDLGDLGKQCLSDVECATNESCVQKPGATDHVCTKSCTSFTDCPTYWSCDEIGSAYYCILH